MTACDALRDRMPEVARGLGQWTAAEAAHLRECGGCRGEWELVAAAAMLGRSVAIDPARIAAGVEARLAAEPRKPARSGPLRVALWLAGAAAAAAIGVAVVREAPVRTDPRPGGYAVLTELDDLDVQELEAVLEVLAPPQEEVPTVDPARLGDLTTQELERILRSLEG